MLGNQTTLIKPDLSAFREFSNVKSNVEAQGPRINYCLCRGLFFPYSHSLCRSLEILLTKFTLAPMHGKFQVKTHSLVCPKWFSFNKLQLL